MHACMNAITKEYKNTRIQEYMSLSLTRRRLVNEPGSAIEQVLKKSLWKDNSDHWNLEFNGVKTYRMNIGPIIEFLVVDLDK